MSCLDMNLNCEVKLHLHSVGLFLFLLALCKIINRFTIMQSFGKERLSDFKLKPHYININHGSYGLVPTVVLNKKIELLNRCEENPEKWFRRDAEKLMIENREFVAQRLKCHPKNLVFVHNATEAANSLLKSMKWSEGDVLLLPNIAYASVKKTVSVLKDNYGINVLELEFTKKDLQTPESIQTKVESFVNSYPSKIKLAIIDHISSVPAVVFPVKALSTFFRYKEIPLFIDGAHAIGQVAIDLSDIQPAAYFSNFHKWAYAPKSAAFLYVSDEFLPVIKPAVTGIYHGQEISREFFSTGTRDLTSLLCAAEGLKFLESFDAQRVRNYCHNLALSAARKVAAIWGTSLFSEDDRIVANLVNVLVPSNDSKLCQKIALEMAMEDIAFPLILSFQDKLYCRLSAQIYNQLGDYEFAASQFLRRLHIQSS